MRPEISKTPYTAKDADSTHCGMFLRPSAANLETRSPWITSWATPTKAWLRIIESGSATIVSRPPSITYINGYLEELPMVANPTVRLILQPLRKCMDAADRVDAWHDEHQKDIASSRAELGLSTVQTADQGKFVTTDMERSLDPLGLDVLP